VSLAVRPSPHYRRLLQYLGLSSHRDSRPRLSGSTQGSLVTLLLNPMTLSAVERIPCLRFGQQPQEVEKGQLRQDDDRGGALAGGGWDINVPLLDPYIIESRYE